MKIILALAVITSFVLLGFWFCVGFSNPSRNISNNLPLSTTPKPAVREVVINQSKTFNQLEITIIGIKVTPINVEITMKLVNKSKYPLSFFPSQKSIVIGKKQLDAKVLHNNDLSGEINDGVEKIGVVVFEDKSGSLAPFEINKVDLKLGDIYNNKTYKTVECNWLLEIPAN